MDISVIPIGNSKGIRLTKNLIEKYNIGNAVEISLKKDYFVVKPKKEVRKGWEKAFKKMHESKDDKLIIPDIFDDENFNEWK